MEKSSDQINRVAAFFYVPLYFFLFLTLTSLPQVCYITYPVVTVTP